MVTLDDAYAKLKGGKKRLTLLESDIEALRSGKASPYVVTHKRDRANPNAFRAKDGNPLLPLGVDVGAILVDYRAALNSTIHALYELDTGKPLGKKEKRDFPICEAPDNFRSRRKPDLEGLSADHIAIVERAQPYKGRHVLLYLIDSNQHKHRGGIIIRATGGSLIQASIQPLDKNAAIETLRFPGERYLPKTMNMQARVFGEITFRNGAPVVYTLQAIHAEVADILAAFEPFFD